MKDFDKVELLDGDTIEWQGTWKEFVDGNVDAGMEREEIKEVEDTLDRGETHTFGGGASSVFILRKISRIENALRSHGEYNFEKEDGEFGAPYGVNLLRHTFPDAYRVKGMACFYIPTIGKVVATCRSISQIGTTKGRKPMAVPFVCTCHIGSPVGVPFYCEVHLTASRNWKGS